jgi:hypothetical protein
MAGYSKLFSEIVTSSIWSEDDKTRIVWITMLALKDSRGFVPAALPGLANAARVTVEECEAAVAKLETPDKYSRTAEHEGRRIQHVEGGWMVLNHEKYREKRSDEERREYQRRWQAEHRRRQNVDHVDTNVDTCRPPLTYADAYTYTDTLRRGGGGEPPPPGILELCSKIKNCRPEYKNLNQMALENALKGIPPADARKAVDDFCKKETNKLQATNDPISLLRGFLRKAFDGPGSQPKVRCKLS